MTPVLPRCTPRIPRFPILATFCAVLALAADGAADAANLPAYTVVPIGADLSAVEPTTTFNIAVAVNEDDDAVGWASISGQIRGFLYTAEYGPVLLPTDAGARPASQAVDLSDRDAQGIVRIVGMTATGIYDTPGLAHLWSFDTGTGAFVDDITIGALPGHSASAVAAINNSCQVVGYSLGTSAAVPSTAMLYDCTTDTLTELDFPALPTDISDSGIVVGGTWRGDTAGSYASLGIPADLHIAARITAVNDAGHVAGSGTRSYGDGNGRSVASILRHVADWEILASLSAFDGANDINNHDDVVGQLGYGAALNAVVWLEDVPGLFSPTSLLAPGSRDQSMNYAMAINDDGVIAGAGSAGAMLLVPDGNLPAPDAPADLDAIPHVPTAQQPWNAITLAWTGSGDLATGYRVERRDDGAMDWTVIEASWPGTTLWDLDVALGATYDYRVIALGVAGESEPSAVASATAPSDPVDIDGPLVEIVTPAEGDSVEGKVRVRVEASDDVAVDYMEVYIVGEYASDFLCSKFHTDVLECSWNAGKLDPGVYQVEAYACDALGNGNTVVADVIVGEPRTRLSVGRIKLKAGKAGDGARLKARIKLIDGNGRPARAAARLIGTWTGPGGLAEGWTVATNTKGRAKLDRDGPSGAWTLAILDIVADGFRFDPDGGPTTATAER